MPSVSPKNFNVFMQRTKKVPEKILRNLVRKSALSVFRDVTKFTPVDTGRARGSWSVFLNTPPSNVDVGDVGGESAANGINVTVGAKIASAKPFGLITISNTIPYIGVLNDGGPNRAPAGMVERALANLRLQLNKRKTVRVV